MKIGNKIKELRRQRGITQEQLANSMGISPQAVSKWENGIGLPDITLMPVLAGFFEVTMDELFDFSLQKIEAEVEKIAVEAAKFRESDPEKSRRMLEDALKIYPENDILLNNLLYVMNYKENPEEMIRVASALIEKTTQSDVKYDALRFLAYAYKAAGDVRSAEAAIELIPEIYFTKLTEAAGLFEGRVKYEAAKKQKWISFEQLLQMMGKLAECYESEGEIQKAVEEIKKARRLILTMEDERFSDYTKYFDKQLARLKAPLF